MRKYIICIILILIVISIPVSAYVPYDSYNFTNRMGELKKVPCPAPFIPVKEYNSISLNETLKSPEDIFIAENGYIYIADSVENKIIVTDGDWNIKKIIKEFDNKGTMENLNSVQGIFVTPDGDLYIADTGNSRIVILDSNENLKSIISKPESDIFDENYVFKPAKISVDASKNIFVVARDEFNGVMQFDDNGTFIGFLGSNIVYPSRFELIWRRILTRQQISQSRQLIPLEYSNISIDDTGFLYVVTGTLNERVKVKKLSPNGQNILTTSSYMQAILSNSNISAITVDENDNYFFIDNSNGNINAFNKDGNMLYAFGGFGNQLGTFKFPTAIRIKDNFLYVTDKVNSNITVFKMSDYALLINEAYNTYSKGDYEVSKKLWRDTLKLNGNLELAYVQMGRIYYKEGNYSEAMKFFKLGNYRGENYVSGYGNAFSEYRRAYLAENLPKILTIVVAASLMIIAIIYRKKGKVKNVEE